MVMCLYKPLKNAVIKLKEQKATNMNDRKNEGRRAGKLKKR